MDMSSGFGLSFCVKRATIPHSVVHPRTTKRLEALIGADRRAVIQAIRDARTRAGLTQEKAAALRSHATSTISRWETGGMPNDWAELAAYAHALRQPITLHFGPHAKEAAPPDWAKRLQDRIDQIAKRVGVTPDEEQSAVDATTAGLKSLPIGETPDHPEEDGLADEAIPGEHGEEE
jgi:transcriptional regulator with XRE-family HTH domain